MLQQTQVSRVLIKYPPFLKRFPDIRSLAVSKRRDVVLAWQGMGYNNRAVRLHTLSKIVFSDHAGVLPSDFVSLASLPGIGRYTANAVLSSAFRKRVPIVDTNVHRVLSRVVSGRKSVTDRLPLSESWDLAGILLPRRRSHDWNQALMDLGATLCTATSPSCPACPVSQVCASAGKLAGPEWKPKRRERSFHGIPNRIHRGRVVDILRNEPMVPMTRLGRLLHPSFSQRNMKWLEALLESLETDGLVRIGRSVRGTRRVSLA
ncbi:MAG: A/G-specific adenine glycosylase [Ignavibacteria bacterium]|nr:A/G-specific adenine glycosylase [Ignavibacteria bacterium]